VGLITVVAAVAISSLADLAGRGIATIGDVPTGLPPFGIPLVAPGQLGAIAVGGISLALVALAEGLAATRLFASRGGYRVETERELIGMGGANIASGSRVVSPWPAACPRRRQRHSPGAAARSWASRQPR
jgi:SulP family sulfate permease